MIAAGRLVLMLVLMLPLCASVVILGLVSTVSLRFLHFILETAIMVYGKPPTPGLTAWMAWMQGRCSACGEGDLW
jgi:hypothetical protein